MYNSILIFLSLLLFSCQHTKHAAVWSPEAFKQDIKEFEGKNVRKLINEWGYFDRKFQDPDGPDVYEYSFSHFVREPIKVESYPVAYSRFTPTTISGGATYHIYCRVWFKVEEKKITKVSWKGNGCAKEIKK